MRKGYHIHAIILLGLGAAVFWLGRESAPLMRADQGENAVQRAEAIHRAERPTQGRSRDSSLKDSTALAMQVEAPLPPAGTPLAQIKDELDARARRGDVRAACRLGADLMRCRVRLASQASATLMRKMYVQSNQVISDDTVSALASMENNLDKAASLCEGVGESDLREAIVYQRIAAERGNARMRLWYAADPALNRSDFLDDLEAWQGYRAVAMEYIEQALAAGDPDAPDVLAGVYQPRDALIHSGRVPLRQPDAHRYFVYRALSALLHPERPEIKSILAAPEPGPEIDMQVVHAEAQALRKRFYANYRPDEAKSSSPGVPGMFHDADDAQQLCGP